VAGLKILIAFSSIGHYHHARISAACAKGEICALAMSGMDSGLLGQVDDINLLYKLFVLHPKDAESLAWCDLLQAINGVLDKAMPDVVAVPGYVLKSALALIYASKKRGIPLILMSDSNLENMPRYFITEMVKKRLVSICDAGFVAGKKSRAYMKRLGMVENSIFDGYDVVDNEHFINGNGTAAPEGFLFVGRFVSVKNIPFLLRAYSIYKAQLGGRAWPLKLIGTGELENELIALANALNLQDKVQWLGYKDYEKINDEYHRSKILILPSLSETWGLVVNEAMASRLPVLVSSQCGCIPDLVNEGINGYIFNPTDIKNLIALMLLVSGKSSDELCRMGDESLKIISYFGLSRFSDNLWEAAGCAIKTKTKTFGFMDGLLIKFLFKAREGL